MLSAASFFLLTGVPQGVKWRFSGHSPQCTINNEKCTMKKFPAATPRQTLSPACGAVDGSPGCSHAVAEPGVECKNDEESGQHRDCDAVEDGRLNGDGR